MTKDLAALIGPNQPSLNTRAFLDVLGGNLRRGRWGPEVDAAGGLDGRGAVP